MKKRKSVAPAPTKPTSVVRRASKAKRKPSTMSGSKSGAVKTRVVLKLLDDWMKDESGYDEATWPALKQALDRERKKVGARSLFDE